MAKPSLKIVVTDRIDNAHQVFAGYRPNSKSCQPELNQSQKEIGGFLNLLASANLLEANQRIRTRRVSGTMAEMGILSNRLLKKKAAAGCRRPTGRSFVVLFIRRFVIVIKSCCQPTRSPMQIEPADSGGDHWSNRAVKG
jgi:hypothetical protein